MPSPRRTAEGQQAIYGIGSKDGYAARIFNVVCRVGLAAAKCLLEDEPPGALVIGSKKRFEEMNGAAAQLGRR